MHRSAVLCVLLFSAMAAGASADAAESRSGTNGLPENRVARPQVHRFNNFRPKYGKEGIASLEQFGVATGATLASGVVFFEDTETPWTQWYDEVLICFSVNGTYEIEIEGVVQRLSPGDMIWLPAGTSLIHRVVGEAVAFYAVTPADYAAHAPSGMPIDE